MNRHFAWFLCFFVACSGSVTQEVQDPTNVPDASPDAPSESLVIGRSCTGDPDCGGEMFCYLSPSEGYCTLSCTMDKECPSGSVCSPIPLSRVPTGMCMKSCATDGDCRAGYACAVVSHFPGQPNSGSSSSPVCWIPQNSGP